MCNCGEGSRTPDGGSRINRDFAYGQVARTLDVGHQIAAVYEDRSKAICWDGKNEVGETVASGVYFYHLSAGDYSATRKMLILKC